MIAELITAGIPAIMQLIQHITPMLPTAGAGIVGGAVDVLTRFGPLVVKGYQGYRPIVTGAIDAIRSNPVAGTNPDWIAKLRALSATIDHRYDDALARAEAEDKAAGDEG